jgi:hypothetical protein
LSYKVAEEGNKWMYDDGCRMWREAEQKSDADVRLRGAVKMQEGWTANGKKRDGGMGRRDAMVWRW